MEKYGIKVDRLPSSSSYVRLDEGVFDLERALNLCGKFAGVCYDKEGFKHLEGEPKEKTQRRIDMTLNNGHHSVYGHPYLSLNLQNIPKILAMILNNEHQYTTSEKSARYTPVVRQEGSIITLEEEELYNKWIEIFKVEIKKRYGNVFDDKKIQKLAQENARYLVTVFMPTQMVYTTSLRQINLLYAWSRDYVEKNKLSSDPFVIKLSQALKEFADEIEKLNVLVKELYANEKARSFSLFNENIHRFNEFFNENGYSTQYKGSYAQLAQAQRHRTLYYQMEMLGEKDYFIPPIIEENDLLSSEWLKDISSVGEIYPQGELVLINESGISYLWFLEKCKERLCSAAQQEIMVRTKQTLDKYITELKAQGSPAAEEMELYSHGARCTFPNYRCKKPCAIPGMALTRKI